MTVFHSIQSVNVVTLGCSKNIVDSEFFLGRLKASGKRILVDSEESADLVVINTCGFIREAKEESLAVIFRWLEAKKQGKVKAVAVVGCLAQRYRNEIMQEIPEADLVMGTEFSHALMNAFDHRKTRFADRMLITPPHYAYLKIAEGCDRTCAFCAIPKIRGKHQSVPIETLLKQAKQLALKGVRELILVSQDTTYYGLDLYKKQMLPELVKKLSAIKELEWIRIQYAYPAMFPAGLLDVMRSEEKVCRYLDIPVQHISDKMLKVMKRNISRKQTEQLIETIRTKLPGVCLRTSLITGHPGETEKEFDQLLRFVQSGVFDRLGVFVYSHEEDTYSHRHYKDIVPAREKAARARMLMEAQQPISYRRNYARIGQPVKILVDAAEHGVATGRTESDAPEVDNDVIWKTKKKIHAGTFHTVVVTGARDYSLLAG